MDIMYRAGGFKRCELLPHNQETYNEAMEQLRLYGRTAIVQPTGTGKNYIMLKILQDYCTNYKLVIGDSLDAIYDLMDKPEWVHNRTYTITYSNIDNFLNKLGYTDDGGNIDSIELMDSGVTGIDFDLKLIVLDEMHRAGAETWNRSVNRLLKLFPNAYVLGLTATPIRFLDKRRDMVSELFNGISAGNLTIKSAVEMGILPRSTYVLSMLSISDDMKMARSKIKHRQKRIDSQTTSHGNSVVKNKLVSEVEKMLDDYESRWSRDTEIVGLLSKYLFNCVDKNYKHIVFAPSIDVADGMEPVIRSWFNEVYRGKGINVGVYQYHSGNPNKTDAFNSFRVDKGVGYCDVMIVVNMANSSLHIKNTKSVMMLRYTNSPNMYIQQIGRAMSVGGDEPIIFDFVGNLSSINEVTNFLYGMESKVTRSVNDGSALNSKVFSAIDDNTNGFRELIETVGKVVSVPWYVYMYKLIDYVNEHKIKSLSHIEDVELHKWAIAEQKKFIGNKLTLSKDVQFRRIGILAYTTPLMEEYGKQWFSLIDKLGSNDSSVDKQVEMVLKYRLYCGFLPAELEKYMTDTGIDLGISETWFKETCRSLSQVETDKFYSILDRILNDTSIRLSNETNFNLDKYIECIDWVVRLRKFIRDNTCNVENGESKATMFAHLLRTYWNSRYSDLIKCIELDDGTLRNHLLLYRYVKSRDTLADYELCTVGKILNTDMKLRSGSLNRLIGILGIV